MESELPAGQPSQTRGIPAADSSSCEVSKKNLILCRVKEQLSTTEKTEDTVGTCTLATASQPQDLPISSTNLTNGLVAAGGPESILAGGLQSPMAAVPLPPSSSSSLAPPTSSYPPLVVTGKGAVPITMTVSGGGGKHALRQQARRRRRNTSIAAGNSPPITRITMKALSSAQQLCGNTQHLNPPPLQQHLQLPTSLTGNVVTTLPLQQLQQLQQAQLSVISSSSSPVAITVPLTTNGLTSSAAAAASSGAVMSNALSSHYSALLTSRSVNSDAPASSSNCLSPMIASSGLLSNSSPGLLFNACKDDSKPLPLGSFHSSIGSDLSSIVNSAISSVVTISARNSNNTRLSSSSSPLSSRNANSTLRNLVANSKSFNLSNKNLITYSNNAKNKSCISKQLSLNKVNSTRGSATSNSLSDSVVTSSTTSKQAGAARAPRSSQRSSSRIAWTTTTSSSAVTASPPAATTTACTSTVVSSPTVTVATATTPTPHLSPSLPTACGAAGRALRVSAGQSSPSSQNVAPSTMQDYLAAIPGFKPRKRSGRKLSTAAQLAQSKEGNIDLETPDSILCGVNLRAALNNHTFGLLSAQQQARLMPLMPELDLETCGSSKRLASGSLNNEFFGRACESWRCRLNAGEFTHDSQMKMKAEAEKERMKLDPWKVAHFEPVWGVKPSALLPPPLPRPPLPVGCRTKWTSAGTPGSLPNRTSSDPKSKLFRTNEKLMSILKLLSDRELSRKKSDPNDDDVCFKESIKSPVKEEDESKSILNDCLIVPSKLLLKQEDSAEAAPALPFKIESCPDPSVTEAQNLAMVSSALGNNSSQLSSTISYKRKGAHCEENSPAKKICLSPSFTGDSFSRISSEVELLPVSVSVSSSLQSSLFASVASESTVSEAAVSLSDRLSSVLVTSSSTGAITTSPLSSELPLISCSANSCQESAKPCSALESLPLSGEVNIVHSDCTITRVTVPGGGSASGFVPSVASLPGLVLRSSSGRQVGHASSNTVTIKPSSSSHPTRLSARLSNRSLRASCITSNNIDSLSTAPHALRDTSISISLSEPPSDAVKSISSPASLLSSQASLQSLQSCRSHLTIEQLPPKSSTLSPVSLVSSLPQVTIHPVPPKTTPPPPPQMSSITFTRLASPSGVSPADVVTPSKSNAADVASTSNLLVIRKLPPSPSQCALPPPTPDKPITSASSSRPITIIPYHQPATSSSSTGSLVTSSIRPAFTAPPVLLRGLRLFRIAEPAPQSTAAPNIDTSRVSCVPVPLCVPVNSAVDVTADSSAKVGTLLPPSTPPRSASVPPNKTTLINVSPRPNSVGPHLMLASPSSQDRASPAVHLISPPGMLVSPVRQDGGSEPAVGSQTILLAERSQSNNVGPGYVTITSPVQSLVSTSKNIDETSLPRLVSNCDLNLSTSTPVSVTNVGSETTLISSVPGNHFLSESFPNPDNDRGGPSKDEDRGKEHLVSEVGDDEIEQEEKENASQLHIPDTEDAANLDSREAEVTETKSAAEVKNEECSEEHRGQLQLRFSKSQLERFREESSAQSVTSDDLSEYTDKNTDVLEEEEEEEIDDEEEEEEDVEDDEEEEDVDFTGLASTEFVAEQFQHLTEQEQLQLKQLQEQQIQLERQIEQQQQLLQLQQQHQAQLQYLGDPDEDQHSFAERQEGYEENDDRGSGHFSLKRSTQLTKEHEVYDVEDDEDAGAAEHQDQGTDHEVVELHDEDDDISEHFSNHMNGNGEDTQNSVENVCESEPTHEDTDVEMLESNVHEPTFVDLEGGDADVNPEMHSDEHISQEYGEHCSEFSDDMEVSDSVEVSHSNPHSETLEQKESKEEEVVSKQNVWSNYTVSSMSLRSNRRASNRVLSSPNTYLPLSSRSVEKKSDLSKEEHQETNQDVTQNLDMTEQSQESFIIDQFEASETIRQDEARDPEEHMLHASDRNDEKTEEHCCEVSEQETTDRNVEFLPGNGADESQTSEEMKEEDARSLPDFGDCNQDIEELGSIQNIDDCLSNIESLENIDDCPSNLNSLDHIDDYPSNIDSFDNIDECPSNIDSLDQLDDLPSNIDSPNNLESFPDEETRDLIDSEQHATVDAGKNSEDETTENIPGALTGTSSSQVEQEMRYSSSETCGIKAEDSNDLGDEKNIPDDAVASQENVTSEEAETKLENPCSVPVEEEHGEASAMDVQENSDMSPSCSAAGETGENAGELEQQQQQQMVTCAVVKQENVDGAQPMHFTTQNFMAQQQQHQYQQMKPMPQQHMMMYGKQFINCNPGGLQPMIYNMNAVVPAHMNNTMMPSHVGSNNIAEAGGMGSNGMAGHMNMGHMIQVVGSNVMRPNMTNTMMAGHIIGPNQRFPGFFNNMQQNMNNPHMHMHNAMHMNNMNSHVNMQATMVNGGNGTMMNMGNLMGSMSNQNFINVNKLGNAAAAVVINTSPPALRTNSSAMLISGHDDAAAGGQADDGSADDGCPCNMKAMVVCLKCGAFCHHDCMSPARLCGTCLVR